MFDSYAYLTALVFSILGLGALDRRFGLAFFAQRRATILTVCISVIFFLVWDVAGVEANIFFIGDSEFLTGIRVLPEVPIEEIFFLILLSYNSLLAWRAVEVRWKRM